MKKVDAFVSWGLIVECPNCHESVDFANDDDYDCDSRFSVPIFNNRWDELEGEEVVCHLCDKEFIINKVEI